jgi:N-acetylmuramoyl-L-alanine amidase
MKYFQGRENSGHVDLWFGVVEDRDDPLNLGRVRVRIFGFHTQDKNKIPTGALPWAVCMQPTTSPSMSGVGHGPTGIVTGTHVVGVWLDGSASQYPFVIGTIPGAEVGQQEVCSRDNTGYEAFTGGFLLPASFKSQAVDPIADSNNVFNISWMPFAEGELSTRQSKEDKIQKYLSETNIPTTTDDVDWNNAFVTWVVQKGDIAAPGTNSSDDWRNWGTRVAQPTYGAIATLQGTSSANSRYVGFYLGDTGDGNVSILGPSTTGDPVQIQKVSSDRILMYNMPPGYSGSTIRSGTYAAAVGFVPPSNSGVVPNAGTSNTDSNTNKVSPTRAYIRENSNMDYKFITIHCSATPKGRDIGRNEINQMHIQRGWSEIGYHFVIRINGTVEKGRALNKVGAHVGAHNQNNLGICLVGGVNENNVPLEGLHHYTHAQISALDMLLQECLDQWPNADVKGHRDWPAVAKACPCFNVKTDYLQGRQKFFKNNSSRPKDQSKSEPEKKEEQNLKQQQSSADSSKDTSEVEPTSDNIKTYSAPSPEGKDPTGFQDPRGQYPTVMSTCFNGGTSVNPLIHKSGVGGTPVYNSNQQRRTNVPMASKGAAEVVSGDAKADGPIGPLTQDQVKKYMDIVGKRESSNNYKSINQYGFCGKYQFGAAALASVGYVKRGTSNRGLANPDAWLGKDGVNSRDAWLNNKEAQEKAMYLFTKMNYNTLLRMGVVNDRSDGKHVAGSLMLAHLLGPGGARKYVIGGRDGADANGTKGSSYYNLGKTAVQ